VSAQRSALIALFVGACGIGLAPIFPKLAFDAERLLPGGGVGMIATAFWRTALAAPLFWWLHARTPRATPSASRSSKKLLWLPGIAFAADLAAWHKAFEFTSLANATLLANLASIFVAAVGYLWLRERLGWTFVTGAVVAFTGTGVLLGVDLGYGRDPLTGDLLGLLTACFYASYLLLVKILRRDFSVALIMAYSSSISAGGLLLIAYLAGEQLVPRTWEAWSAVIALALVSHAGGQGLIAYAMAHLPASFATLSLLIQPVITAGVSWVLFSQTLSPVQIGGGVLVLAGLAVARRDAAAG
jgi:drug/metabolite transporter (DMT)-like permease